jgi:hypothetical protein
MSNHNLQLHPLCTLFPRMSEADFDAMTCFSGIRHSGHPGIAYFRASENHLGYWNFVICDVLLGQRVDSKKPIAGDGIFMVLEQFGGARNWKLEASDLVTNIPLPSVAEKAEMLPNESQIVYFLRAGDFIKIGKATGSPKNRIASLQTGCPYPITLIGFIHGGISEEFALHRRFAADHAYGEWFHAKQSIIDFIESQGVSA